MKEWLVPVYFLKEGTEGRKEKVGRKEERKRKREKEERKKERKESINGCIYTQGKKGL